MHLLARLHRSFGIASAVLLLTGVSASTQNTASAAASFRVGGEAISIPAPGSELQEIGADYRVLFDRIVPDSNRLVAVFLTADDLEQVRAQKAPALSNYGMIQVLRRAEFADFTPEMFAQIADAMGQQFGAVANGTLQMQQDALNRRVKAFDENAATINLDHPVPLGSFFSRKDEAGFGMIMGASANGQTKRLVAGIAIVRVHNRFLYAYVYNEMKGEPSVQAIRVATERWADAILAANK